MDRNNVEKEQQQKKKQKKIETENTQRTQKCWRRAELECRQRNKDGYKDTHQKVSEPKS